MEVKPGFKPSDVGAIPTDWHTGSCSAISDLITVGIVVRPTQYYAKQGVPALRSANIREDGIDDQDMVFISEKANALLSKSQVRTGDVLTVRTGYPGTSAVVPPSFAGSNCIDILITRPSNAVNSQYLSAWINSSLGKYQVLRNQGGLAQQHFNVGDLRNLVVALPPTLAEQEAIAEALSDGDALIESLEQLVAKKRQLKQGAMQELLAGKKRLPGFSGKWEVKRIADLAVLSKSGINPGSNPEALFTHFSLPAFDAGAVPVVEQGGLIGSNKFVVPPNAVLLSKLNPRIPRIWAPWHIPTNAVCSTEFLVLVPREGTDRGFFTTLCRSPAVSYQMELHAIGTTGSHQRINPTQVLAIEVSAPSDKAEQIAVASIFSDMDTEIAALEAKLAKARQLKQGMMQELLTGRIRLV